MKRRVLAVALIGFLAVLGGCATSGGSGEAGSSAEATGKPRGVAPPAGSPLSKVELGMSDTDVRKAIGEPTSSHSYMTGKSWIPFYYGTDTTRSEWQYKGQGRVVFSRNQYTGGLKVIRVDYDPDEQGR